MKISRAKKRARKAVIRIMDCKPTMMANCSSELGFGSRKRDTSVNQAHNQQRGKAHRRRKAEYWHDVAAVVVVASLFAVTCPYIQFL